MLTKRTKLGAGALALALMVAACSNDRAGGATGVDETPSAPRALAPPPVAIATPSTPEGIAPGGDGGSAAATEISSSYYEGHQVVLSEVTTSSGAKVKRVTLDGVVQVEFSGDDISGGETADTKAFLDGQLVFNETLDLTSSVSSSTESANANRLVATTPQGPQLMAALPCSGQLALFGAASLAAGTALMAWKWFPSAATWDVLKIAVGLEVAAATNLLNCLRRAW